MNIEVKALDSFLHGKHDVTRDQKFKVTKPEAEELEKSGLVEIVGDSEPQVETKMDAAPENKMVDAPANKSRAKKEA